MVRIPSDDARMPLPIRGPILKLPARALAPGCAANLEEAKSLSGWRGILGALATATNFTRSLKNQRLLAISY